MNKLNKKGFTLIELMVAIAIVAVLAVIGITLFQGAQASARDTKRRADVDAIAQALENNFDANNGTYTNPVPVSSFTGGNIPVDPLTGSDYTLTYGTGDTSFLICTQLEKAGGNSSDVNGTASSGANATFYCRFNQQS